MNTGEGRARGRARGRGRSQQQQQQHAGAPRRPGDSRPTIPPPAETTVGVSRVCQRPSTQRDTTNGAGGAGGGDSGMSGLVQRTAAMNVSSAGDSHEATVGTSGSGASAVGRGAARGRREMRENRTIDVTRPVHVVSKKGDTGDRIQLMTNYFSLVDRTSWSIKQYHVDFDPPEDNTRLRKKLLRPHQSKLGQHYIFDGTALFLERALPDKEVEYISKNETDDKPVRLLIKFIREVPPTDYVFLHIFNIITNMCMSLIGYQKLKKMDRDYFDIKAAQRANQGILELWPGFRAAVAQHESRVLMCVSVSHKLLRTDTVLDQLAGLQQRCRDKGDLQRQAERQLLGAIVMCRHNLRTYRVDDVLWNESPDSCFDFKGRQISIKDYFKERYQLSVSSNQPLICSRPKKREMRAGQTQPFWLVPELCNMTGLSDEMRNNFTLMKELSAFLNMPPHQRVNKLREFAAKLNSSQEVGQLLDCWGLRFSRDPLTIQARVLPPQKVRTDTISMANNGAWNDAVKTGLTSVVPLKKWVFFYSGNNRQEATKCLSSVIQVAKGFKMPIDEPRMVELTDHRLNAYINCVETNTPADAQLVMCMVGSKDKTMYDAIKQLLCLRRPVPSQVVTARLFRNPAKLLGIATKIAIQLNCKLGGVPWEVQVPLKGAMVVGYDTYHESQRRDASAGGWVSSLNAPCTRYFSCATIHTNREEICSHMQINMNKSLEAYRGQNGSYPQTVFVYRDGVGEGQVRYVKDTEVDALKTTLLAKCPGAKLCFIIVSKNINTRFFLSRGRIENPPPGTVVDDDVTLPQRYDFYLVSQSTRIGAVTPTMYNVIHDESGLVPNHLQALTYKLTHLYYNMSSTVRVPAPCHYAHRLAFLVGQSLHKEPSQQLANELFFL